MTRPLLGIFPLRAVSGCLAMVPVLVEGRTRGYQIRGGTAARFYQGHGACHVCPLVLASLESPRRVPIDAVPSYVSSIDRWQTHGTFSSKPRKVVPIVCPPGGGM